MNEIITQSDLNLLYSRNMHNYTQRNFVVLHFSMCKSLRLSNYAKKHVHNKPAASLYLRRVHQFPVLIYIRHSYSMQCCRLLS